MVVLWILGEGKSGKSELAEAIFSLLPGEKFYIGTLPRTDKWMETIRKHAKRRPKEWKLIENEDSLNNATNIIRKYKYKGKKVAFLLDGWGVYVERRILKNNVHTEKIIKEVYTEYQQLMKISNYLIVVAHISLYSLKSSVHKGDKISYIAKTITRHCIAKAEKIIYHGLENISHKDRRIY